MPAERSFHEVDVPRQRRPKAKRPPRFDGKLRRGGIEPEPLDPLRHAPLRETYGANSGAPQEQMGTPATVTKPRLGLRRRARRRG